MTSATVAKLDAALLIAAATLGTLPVVLLVSACMARFLPASADARHALGFSPAVSVWLAAVGIAFSSRSGWRVLTMVLPCAVLAVTVDAVPH
jgi:hypothetical protein